MHAKNGFVLFGFCVYAWEARTFLLFCAQSVELQLSTVATYFAADEETDICNT